MIFKSVDVLILFVVVLGAFLIPGGPIRFVNRAIRFTKNLRPGLLLLLQLLIVVVVPALLIRSSPKKAPFDRAPMERLRHSLPDYVFIGDSMVYTRIDVDVLSGVSTGRRGFILKDGGSGSARWYLFFKNYVLGSGIHPRAVFIMFRDRLLTIPGFRTEGADAARLQTVMHDEEPVVEAVLKTAARAGRGRCQALAETAYPLSEWNTRCRLKLDALSARVVGEKEARIRHLLDREFEVKNLRPDVPLDLTREYSDLSPPFDPSPVKSFLPHIIDLANEHEIKLCFYRIKRRPARGDYSLQDPDLADYVQSLGTYLRSRGCAFYDESLDSDVVLSMFADGDHVKPSAMASYTTAFWRKVSSMVP